MAQEFGKASPKDLISNTSELVSAGTKVHSEKSRTSTWSEGIRIPPPTIM